MKDVFLAAKPCPARQSITMNLPTSAHPTAMRKVTLIDKPSDEVPLMELRIREGRRITIVELDAKTGWRNLARPLQEWADKNKQTR